MMEELMKSLLIQAVDEFSDTTHIITSKELQQKWDVCTAWKVFPLTQISDLKVRSFIIGLGQILKEDMEKHTCVSTVEVKQNEALIVTYRNEECLAVIACAHEGLIHQGLAEKAIARVAERIENSK